MLEINILFIEPVVLFTILGLANVCGSARFFSGHDELLYQGENRLREA